MEETTIHCTPRTMEFHRVNIFEEMGAARQSNQSAVRNLQERMLEPRDGSRHLERQTIGDVMKMEVDEAAEILDAMPVIGHSLQLLKDVGLGYRTARTTVTDTKRR